MKNSQKIQHTSVYLPKAIHTELRIACLRKDVSMSELVVKALQGRWHLDSALELACPSRAEVGDEGER